MKYFLGLVAIMVLVLIKLVLYRKNRERRQLALDLYNRERTQLTPDSYRVTLETIKKAVDQFSGLLDPKNGYFTNYQMNVWKNTYSGLISEIKSRQFRHFALQKQGALAIKTFRKYYGCAEALRESFNERFVEEELEKYCSFFDSVEGRKLDLQQRTAIVTDEDNNLVIAGAGSGKTTTIVGKANYIIDRYKVPPEEILLISFTNKSVASLASRINMDGVVAKTFHKLGKDIIAEVEGKQPSVFDEDQFRSLLWTHFNRQIQDASYLQKVTEYFAEYLKPPKSQFEFENRGTYIQYMKDYDFHSFKKTEATQGQKTYSMEVVKSIEECRIANFLLFNSVHYEYELPYEYETATSTYRQYKPDFTIMQDGKRIYLEHLAISETGNVPPFFAEDGKTREEAKKRYWEKIKWARKTHRKYGTILIETYSYEMDKESWCRNLTEKLEKAGIALNPKTPREIWTIINEASKNEVENFITLFQTFITLMKSNRYTIDDVISKNCENLNLFQKKRNLAFLEIIKPIFECYQLHLAKRKEIDFSDMINKAACYVAEGSYKKKFRYILIDEFQDISIGRYHLIQAIRQANPGCRLFCVGDDWQSIYRFTGSDSSLITEFEKYFGFAARSRIETTYRFRDPLMKLSSDFILKNPSQIRKELKGMGTSRHSEHKIVYSAAEDPDDNFALSPVFDELISEKDDIEKKTILVLGRYNFDIERIRNDDDHLNINEKTGSLRYKMRMGQKDREITARFLTVHKAKGLEADIVIIVNCNAGKYGFPSEVSDDPVLNLVLAEADLFKNAEERRLFYVAMTRAKENVYFVLNRLRKSKFIEEIEIETGETGIRKCPRCRTADLIEKSGTKDGKQWAFLGCSNYLYGCDYIEWVTGTREERDKTNSR